MDSGWLSVDRSGSRVNLHSPENLSLILPGYSTVMDMDESSKRGFSTISGHSFNRKYCDHSAYERKHRLTAEQVNLLEKNFQEENKLEPLRKSQLAKNLGLPPRQVAVWFQNRRARSKVKQIEKQYDLLKSLYDSLREKHELVLEANEKLKAEVLTLTEKLQASGIDSQPTNNQNARSFPNDPEEKPDETMSSSAALNPAADDEDNFSDVFMAAEQQTNDEPFDWWVWQSISQPLW